jgi:hypothetical protein
VLNLVAGWDPTTHPERVDQADNALTLAIAHAVEQAGRPLEERLAKLEQTVEELQRRSPTD